MAGALLCTAAPGYASYPDKPVRLVVAFAPGSSTDIVARLSAEQMSASLGQTVVVENKPGAGGNIATQQVMNSPADGHALLIHSVAVSVNPSLFANAGYDTLRDLAPVASTSMPPAVPFAKSGRLRPIAVMSAKRSPALPDVPTVAELGYPGFEASTWFAIFAPAKVPAEVLEGLNAEVDKALVAKPVSDRFEALSLEAVRLDRAATRAYVASEVAKWGKLVKDIGVKIE